MSDDSEQKPEQTNAAPVKEVPTGSSQHVTAGPYSPVLRIKASELIVISGQVAVAPDGSLTSENFAQQSEDTLKNCLKQLASAGCSLADVFKVNVYLADLADWGAFNAVYTKLMPDPKPVRTAIGCGLLPGYLVEVEMWAAQ
jgi:2-iminobutanoate/2-iminopropanoate deaminase